MKEILEIKVKELHIKPKSFAKSLIIWYKAHKRELPWRETNDPYLIWISEIILQQTRVNQGLPYYYKFAETFPTVYDLANAPEDKVLRLWQGLGYYSRARNLHACAKMVVDQYDGHFPDEFQSLKKLKGIGDYTAAAIASIAFKKAHPVLDGNVFRVISRIFGLDNDIADPKNKPVFYNILNDLIDKDSPDLFNQGLMEFGALQCLPKNPDCENCIFNSNCVAFKNNLVPQLPVKLKKVKVRTRHLHYLVLVAGGKAFLKQRGIKDIWGGLYDFYLKEGENWNIEDVLYNIGDEKNSSNFTLIHSSDAYKHILTHQRIMARFHVIQLGSPEMFDHILEDMKGYSKNEIVNLPKPRLIDKYLNEVFFSLDLV